MKPEFIKKVRSITRAKKIVQEETIQPLWSNYGQIIRYTLKDALYPSVVVKYINFNAANNHPKGWNTSLSHERKVKSYENEINWYTHFNSQLPEACKTPECFGIFSKKKQHLLVLEDLDQCNFSVSKEYLNFQETKSALRWLAHFHGFYLNNPAKGLWEKGSYWHLDTRPDELREMKDQTIKKAALPIDQKLAKAKYQTIIHGDAKLANFCFSKEYDDVAAVDFQYTGIGVGMKDVAYFLGSCIWETELVEWEDELLKYYFSELEKSVTEHHPKTDYKALETEWRALYSYAWADFTRFLLGWMPTHQKLNGKAFKMMNSVLNELKKGN